MLGAIADILKSRSSEGWLVGGSVRDRLSGRYSPDLDVVVTDDPSKVAKQLAGTLRIPWFSLSERYPTYRVLGPEGHVDIAAVRGEGIFADLAERDFTINAMAVPLAASSASNSSGGHMYDLESLDEEPLLDPFDGAKHLDEGRLVAVSDRIFVDDPLRLMRAARFCHTLGLVPEPALAGMIESQATLLPAAAAERVVSEISITLAAGRTAEAVELWTGLGLFHVVLPELGGIEGGGGPYREGHRSDPAALTILDAMLQSPREWFSAEAAAFLRERMKEPVDGSVARPVALRLAGIVQAIGVERAQVLGRRMRLSGALTSLLMAAARCSAGARGYEPVETARMIAELLPEGAMVGRAAVLYLWDAAPWEPEIVLLAAAGAVPATGAVTGAATTGAVSAGGAAQGVAQEVGPEAARRLMDLAVWRTRGVAPLPLGGEDLMRELGLEGGPALGRVLREVRLAWEAQEVATRSEALKVARKAVTNE